MSTNLQWILESQDAFRKILDSARDGDEAALARLRGAIIETTNALTGKQLVVICEMIFNDIDGMIRGIADAN